MSAFVVQLISFMLPLVFSSVKLESEMEQKNVTFFLCDSNSSAPLCLGKVASRSTIERHRKRKK